MKTEDGVEIVVGQTLYTKAGRGTGKELCLPAKVLTLFAGRVEAAREDRVVDVWLPETFYSTRQAALRARREDVSAELRALDDEIYEEVTGVDMPAVDIGKLDGLKAIGQFADRMLDNAEHVRRVITAPPGTKVEITPQVPSFEPVSVTRASVVVTREESPSGYVLETRPVDEHGRDERQVKVGPGGRNLPPFTQDSGNELRDAVIDSLAKSMLRTMEEPATLKNVIELALVSFRDMQISPLLVDAARREANEAYRVWAAVSAGRIKNRVVEHWEMVICQPGDWIKLAAITGADLTQWIIESGGCGYDHGRWLIQGEPGYFVVMAMNEAGEHLSVADLEQTLLCTVEP